MSEKSVFVGVPIHDGKNHHACVAGMMQMQTAFRGRCAFETHVGSFLPRNRDILTARFLDSEADYFLCLDSDIGFGSDDVEALLSTNLDFVSGCYAKKQPDREIPARLNGLTGDSVLGAEYVPAGFILLSRACVERMVGAYRKMEYKTMTGRAWALWASTFEPGNEYTGEDIAFCKCRIEQVAAICWDTSLHFLRCYGTSLRLQLADKKIIK